MTRGFVHRIGFVAVFVSTLSINLAFAQFVDERRTLVPRIDSSLNRSPAPSLVAALERYLAASPGRGAKRCRLVPSNSSSDRRLVTSFAVRGRGGESITVLVAPVLCGRSNLKPSPVSVRTYAESRSAVIGAVWGAFVLDARRESVLLSAYLPTGVTVLDATDLNVDGVPEFLATTDETSEWRTRERYEIWQMLQGSWSRCAEGAWRSPRSVVRSVFALRSTADTFELVEESSPFADNDANGNADRADQVHIDRRCKDAAHCLFGEDVSRERQQRD